MKSKTVTITVAASFDEVYDFLSNPENMPLWAVHFCKSIRNEDGRWIISTGNGTLYFSVDCYRPGGSIDMFAGPTLETMNLFPIRVIRADSGETAVVFSFFRCNESGVSDEVFLAQYKCLIEEADMLVERFGGGEVSAEAPVPTKLKTGFICQDFEATKNFYVEHFGFRTTFSAPFYAHVERGGGSEQIGLMSIEKSGESAQKEFESPTSGDGIWLSLDVDDVAFEYERLSKAGVSFRQGPTDQPWGERTCIAVDPNGVLIYLGQDTKSMSEDLKKFVVAEDSVLVGA